MARAAAMRRRWSDFRKHPAAVAPGDRRGRAGARPPRRGGTGDDMTTDAAPQPPDRPAVRTAGSIDHLLGAGEHRFLGGGFRRVRRHLRDLLVECGPDGGSICGSASVNYPAIWSLKGHGPHRQPHLSVVDGIVLVAELAEVLLTRRYALDEDERRRM